MNKKKSGLNLKGVTVGTWTRLVTLLLVTANLIASTLGYKLIPFEDDQIQEFVSALLVGIVSIYSAWKNNSITAEAQEADQILKEKKS